MKRSPLFFASALILAAPAAMGVVPPSWTAEDDTSHKQVASV